MIEKIKVNAPDNGLFAAACKVVEIVRNAGYEIYFVGGAVRDMVMNNTPSDIDMVTTALPQDIAVNSIRPAKRQANVRMKYCCFIWKISLFVLYKINYTQCRER